MTVYWVVESDKDVGDTDFVANAVAVETHAVIANHGYRGGPWVVDSVDATDTLPVIPQWQAGHVTVVHEASEI
ncbi:MAG: hypothetical protein J7M25_02045 [Deltaproteobacteria bacterium]|nr:hypothetical protein [Deltaproteobacteria bacterium]